MSIVDKMKDRIFDVADINNDYTQEDFDKEFQQSTFVVNPDQFKFKFNFKNESKNEDPKYATNGSSGFDLRANLEEDVIIESGKWSIIPTGLYFEIPMNNEIQIRSRSGLAAKNGVAVLNSPGTIDADYRGEIKVILINHSDGNFRIKNGDRIAQAVISSVIANNHVILNKVDTIDENTERGSGGFGSTGIK